jgi:Holliday junction resolvase RusA-like endonuclease
MIGLAFTVLATPVPCQRARATLEGTRLRVVTPSKTRIYEERVAWFAIRAMNAAGWIRGGVGPFGVDLQVYRRARQGDADNFAKGVLDGMSKAGVWADDRYVEDLRTRLHADGSEPRVEVRVWILGGDE